MTQDLPPFQYDDPIFFYEFTSQYQGKLTVKMSPHDVQLITDNSIPSKNDPPERQFPIIKQNGTSGFFGVNGYFGSVPVWKWDLLATCFVPQQFYGFRLTGFNNQILDLRGGYSGPYNDPNTIGNSHYSFVYRNGYQQIGNLNGSPGVPTNTADFPYDSTLEFSSSYVPPSGCFFDEYNVYLISHGYGRATLSYNQKQPDLESPLTTKQYRAHISNVISGDIVLPLNVSVDFTAGLTNIIPPNSDNIYLQYNYYASHGGYILGYGGSKGQFGYPCVQNFNTMQVDNAPPTYFNMTGGCTPSVFFRYDYFLGTLPQNNNVIQQWIEAQRLENNSGKTGGFINTLICSDLSLGFETKDLSFTQPSPSDTTFMIDPARGGYVQGISIPLEQQQKEQGDTKTVCQPGFYFPGLWGDANLMQVGEGTINAVNYWDTGNAFRMRNPLRIGLASQAAGYFQTSRRRIKLSRHGDILIPPDYLSAQMPDGGWLFLPPSMSGNADKQTCTGFMVTGDGSAYWELNLDVTPFSPPAWDEDPFNVPDGYYFYPGGPGDRDNAAIGCFYGNMGNFNLPDGKRYFGNGNFGISYDGVLFYIDTYRTPGVLYSSLGNISVTIPKAVIPKHEISTLCRQFGKCYYPWVG